MKVVVQLVEAVRSLWTCPWELALRRTGLQPRDRGSIPDDLQGVMPLRAEDWRTALEGARLEEIPRGGPTVVPVVGSVDWVVPGSWSCDPGSGHDFGDGPSHAIRPRLDLPGVDLLRTWARGRLVDAHDAVLSAALTGDAGPARRAGEIVADFTRRNPPGRGPHWCTAMEVALRAVRLLDAAGLLAAVPDLDEEGRTSAAVAEALRVHERWLAAHGDWRLHFTGNHHLVALAGRFLLAACLPESARRRRDGDRSWRLFWREFCREVGPDGVHFESSTAYHLLVLETAAHVLAVGRRHGRSLGPGARDRLAAAAAATGTLLRPDGTVARIGDGDDACFLELLPTAVEAALLDGRAPGGDGRVVAGLLAALLGDGRLAARAGRRGRLGASALLGVAGRGVLERLVELPRVTSSCFPRGGLGVLASPTEPPTHVTVSATGPGRRGTGGHGHDDAGTYVLWRGRPIVVDRGTGTYTGDVDLRRTLRSAASHSVVSVDDRDQNAPRPGTAFRRLDRAWPVVVGFEHEPAARIAIGHHGFFQAPGRVSVLRSVRLETDGVLVVEDDVRGARSHVIVLRVHWAPGLEPEPAGDGCVVVRDGREGVAVLHVSAIGPDGRPLEPSVEAVTVPHSERQGETSVARATEIRLHSGLPVRLRHRIAPPAAPRRA